MSSDYPYILRWQRPGLPGRKGQRCRVLTRSRRMNSCSIEFPDGLRAIVSRNALRKARAGESLPPNSI